mgnify:CR=1 FL=1
MGLVRLQAAVLPTPAVVRLLGDADLVLSVLRSADLRSAFFASLLLVPVRSLLLPRDVGPDPACAALAKHTGHVRLHLLVTSIMASPVWLLCSGQIPQSYGQPFLVSVRGFSNPVPTCRNSVALWYCP